MKLSCSSIVYLHYPLSEAIRRIAAIGFNGIDIWGGRPHAYCFDLDDQEIVHLRQILQDEGLALVSFIPAQFRYPTNLCSPLEKIRRNSIAYIKESIEKASSLGAPVVSVCPGHTLHGQSYEDGMRRLKDSLSEIAEFASLYRIQIAIEPGDAYETDLLPTCAATLKLTAEIQAENLGVLLDNGHSFVVGESAAQAAAFLGQKLFHVHLDDNNGRRDQHLVPGDGCFEFIPFLDLLKSVGYAGFLTIELGWDYTLDPDPVVRLSFERVNQFLNQLSTQQSNLMEAL